MLRQAIACVAFLTPALVFSTVQGCGDQPDPEDLCLWLTDPNGCYVRFADDVGTTCGNTYVEGNDPLASATGYFAARDDLSICIKNAGGQVIFDPPLDLTMFPVTDVAFTILDFNAVECGKGAASGTKNFSITVNTVDKDDAGTITDPDGGALTDDITGGTFSSTQESGRNAFSVSCPGGTETHEFNDLQISDKCADLETYVPQAIIDSSPGIPESTAASAQNGYVRLRVVYPPADPSTAGGQTRTVEYFNCLIPAPPPPCQDGVKNQDETDIDCGGSCSATCAEGLSCNVDSDCTSGSCGFNGGLKQCLAG